MSPRTPTTPKGLVTLKARPTWPITRRGVLNFAPSEASKRRYGPDRADQRIQQVRAPGTKTVKLRGRAKKITFHVFDPRIVKDLLDREAVVEWREQDAITAVENRRRAPWKRRVTSKPKGPTESLDSDGDKLKGWEEFEREGLLR